MALRTIQKQIQSFSNIKKITQTMKVVSAAKLNRAERLLRDTRPFGYGTLSFYSRYTDINMLDYTEDHLLFAVTSDRGLCGSIHSGIVKKVREELSRSDQTNASVVCIGKKSETMLQRTHPNYILFSVTNIGKNNPTFLDASKIFQMCSFVEYIASQIFYNCLTSKSTSKVDWIPIYSTDILLMTAHITSLDEVEEEELRSYIEFSTISLLYFAMVENATSEHSARVLAMDSATKNVDKLKQKSTLSFNRKRQSRITTDIIDIVSGCEAITSKT
ncbi:ATP synthase subunit gamma, mitochondrial-like [Daktulosphaira vitifoliae]|uniref:ATP synthase subunit gamma, mitochondrial-like n=1 Tax=Daktulosphaira vitifoliae TaxID=58002 RepID=UPI0021AA5E3A|nr:ATP synthase subunit gamma, mitochondrial-like [Daktulosphaira vitifoliae]